MWGGEGGARPKLCYFDRHLNYLIPSLLDNHQNFKIAGGSWVFHAMKKKIWKEWIPKISAISPSPALVFKIPTSRCQYQIPAQFVATQMLCFEVFIQFWFPSIAQDQTQNLRKQSYHYFVPILSIWMCSLQCYLYKLIFYLLDIYRFATLKLYNKTQVKI